MRLMTLGNESISIRGTVIHGQIAEIQVHPPQEELPPNPQRIAAKTNAGDGRKYDVTR